MSGQPAPAPKPKKPFFKRPLTWIIAIAVIVFIGVVANPSSKDGKSATGKPPAADSPSPEETAAVGIGTPLTSGSLEMTVTKVEKGIAKLGTDPISTKAQGQFIVVSMTVKNVGQKAEYFSDSSVKLLSGDGKEFSVSSAASLHLGEDSTLFAAINPGNTLTGKMAFDVPKDADPKVLQFSGSLFGKSAEINLS